MDLFGSSEKEGNRFPERFPPPEMRAQLDHFPDLVLVVDTKGIIRYVSERLRDVLSLAPSDWEGLHFPEDVAGMEYGTEAEFYPHAMLQGEKEILPVVNIIDADNVQRQFEVSGTHLGHSKHNRGYLLVAREVTERHRAQKELLLFKQAVESVNESIFITDMDHRLIFVNRAFEKIYGYARDEIIGRPFHVLRPGGAQLALDDNILAEAGHRGWTGELTNIRKDGTTFPARLSLSTVYDTHQKSVAMIGVVQDITGEKRVEEELIKAEKLESLGVLAGGIAHEFNNILTSVIGNISLAKLSTDTPERVEQLLTTAEESAMRATNLTGKLLTFSKGGEPTKKTHQIEQIIRESLEFTLSGSNVNYELNIETQIFPVSIDKEQILQAFQNIILNADQAMPKGGVLRITAKNILMDQRNRVADLEGRYYVRVTFSDEGGGIPTEVREKIFDPFYSTRDNGSGLGLTTAYSIITRHNGAITVESTPGEGASFDIYLPAMVEQEEEWQETPAESRGQSNARILVMDDEPQIRDICGRMLTLMGHQVEFAVEGKEVLDLYRQHAEQGIPFDLVIMDLTVHGGMGGEKAIQHLLEYDPTARVVVSSGYSNSSVLSDYKKYGFAARVKKPYDFKKLQQVIRKVI